MQVMSTVQLVSLSHSLKPFRSIMAPKKLPAAAETGAATPKSKAKRKAKAKAKAKAKGKQKNEENEEKAATPHR